MNELVRLKSFPSGIKIVISEDADFTAVLSEIKSKFTESEKFFGKAKLAISFEGRKNTPEEEDEIIDTILSSCHLDIACIVNMTDEPTLERVVGEAKHILQTESAQFYRGNINNKQVLETEHNLIILGNVLKGSYVVSKKNIIVLGNLEGNVYAGADCQERFVAALSMNAESVRIGDIKGKTKEKNKGFFGRKKTEEPQIAYVKDEEIIFEDLTFTEELLQLFE